MAVCATACARVRDGAFPFSIPPTIDLLSMPSSEAFHGACMDSIPTTTSREVDFNWMRTEALLGMLHLQNNDVRGCHSHLHRYLALCAQTGFHDEARWATSLSEIDVQERRRLVGLKTFPRCDGFTRDSQQDLTWSVVVLVAVSHRCLSRCDIWICRAATRGVLFRPATC